MKTTNKIILISSLLCNTVYPFNTLSQQSADPSKTQLTKVTMKHEEDFTTTISVDQTPEEVFKSVNNVRGWWSEEVEGDTDKLNAVFNYHYEDVHRTKMKILEFVPNEKVVWLVMENYFKFTNDKTEWTNTKISFEISQQEKRTQLRFTHIGLVPEYECFEICQDAWTNYIQSSLYNLITTGKGLPNAAGKPRTENEKILSAKQ